MATFISQSPEETLTFGERWGREARPGWVLALHGDLGAGKTQFVKGVARGLGITNRVSSPTFALVNEYLGGRLPLHHIDLYRLDNPSQIRGAGLEDYLCGTAGLVLVEWAERWFGSAAGTPSDEFPGLLRLQFTVVSGNERRIDYEDPRP